MDNSRPHNSGWVEKCIEASRAERLPHPAYSPDLAPSAFFLFGYIKGKLSDYNCESREEPFTAVTEIVTRIHQEVPLSVFESCANRPKWAIKHVGKN
jgi:hypothetical protein